MKAFDSADLAGISIGSSLDGFQKKLAGSGISFTDYVRESHIRKWTGEALAHALKIRTALVLGLQEFLVSQNILNIDRVSMSPVTDPLCHNVEHAPVILFQNTPYRTTHSMIYSKMLACMNPFVKGIYIDSPNIRLEMPSGAQRHKYLIDFSQMDIEIKRKQQLTEDDYYDRPEISAKVLHEELDRVLDFLKI